MILASTLLGAAPRYLGRAYSEMDCQAFVEKVLADAGIKKNLAGSNAWYRFALQHGWVGSPEECQKQFGKIPKGAFLFILLQDGREPQKYQGDGIGNANHIGIYTGMTQEEMLEAGYRLQHIQDDGGKRQALAKKAGKGSGAINSSYSWGCVATSKFSGKSISGGWNRVWLWTDMINYKEEEKTPMNVTTATVVLPSGKTGKTVNLRKETSTSSALVARIAVGSRVYILEDLGQWCRIGYGNDEGYMLSNYLEYDGQTDETDGKGLSDDDRAKIDGALKSIEQACDVIGGIVGRG